MSLWCPNIFVSLHIQQISILEYCNIIYAAHTTETATITTTTTSATITYKAAMF